jgi:hypothetical protein
VHAFFVRALIRNLEVFPSASDAIVSVPEAERMFCEALDAVEMASCDIRCRRTDCKHIFLNVIPTVRVDVENVQKYVGDCSCDVPIVAVCCLLVCRIQIMHILVRRHVLH